MDKLKQWWAIFLVALGVLISILMREKKVRDDEAPALREAAAVREKEIISEEATRRRARALAARDKLRKHRSNRRAELLRRARGSKRGGG